MIRFIGQFISGNRITYLIEEDGQLFRECNRTRGSRNNEYEDFEDMCQSVDLTKFKLELIYD